MFNFQNYIVDFRSNYNFRKRKKEKELSYKVGGDWEACDRGISLVAFEIVLTLYVATATVERS